MTQKIRHIQSLIKGLRENIIHYDIFDQFPNVLAITTTRWLNNKLGLENIEASDLSNYFGIFDNNLIRLGQIHSDKIYSRGQAGFHDGFDASIIKETGYYHSILTADCISVFIYSHSDKQTALVHSGWRGTHLNIVGNALQLLTDNGADVSKIYVALGPSLRKCCYEVKEDVAQYFEDFTYNKKGKIYLDLNKAVITQLLENGIEIGHIEDKSECSTCNPDIYFSYRYNQTENRMISLFGVN